MAAIKHRCRKLWPGLAGLGLLSLAVWYFNWYANYHVVIPGELYRSAQLSPENLARHIAEDGLRTIINLRPETNEVWHAREHQVCQSAGVALIDFPLAGCAAPSREQATALVSVFRHATRPLLIHCQHGADRTGFAVALYSSEIAGRPEPQAAQALSLRYGHFSFTPVGCFDTAYAAYVESRK